MICMVGLFGCLNACCLGMSFLMGLIAILPSFWCSIKSVLENISAPMVARYMPSNLFGGILCVVRFFPLRRRL